MRSYLWSVFLGMAVLMQAGNSMAQDVASFEKRTTVKVLKNGLTVIVCQRPEAPVFSFYTLVDAGAAQDPQGQSGMAHMFEHMAFKGTDRIGTTDYAKEKIALEKVEKAYAAYDHEDRRETGRDPAKADRLKAEFDKAVADAGQYVIQNRFGELIEREGGAGLNANTSMDSTNYFYSLPANRLELWAYLESARFLHPVLREFYKERDVVHEERRLRTDSNPIGRMVEQFFAAAYVAHPYQRSGVGWPSELDHLTATEAERFFHKYYVPSNTVVALVGDLQPGAALAVVERYFGRIPASPRPEPMTTVEPEQFVEHTITLRDKSQPIYLEGYHRPGYRDPDDAVYEVISDILSQGRTSRLYRSLVRDKKIAAAAVGFSGLPGQKYPGLFTFFAVPVPGHTTQELAAGFHAEIDRLKNEEVGDDELQTVKTRAKADLIRRLADNEGLAQQLADYQTRYGDWREIFRSVDKIDKVSKADVKRIANKTFVETNRTVALVENIPAAPKPAPAADGPQKETHQ
ncbi:MAG TPA: pitrilysin family protein [Candidatus Saccharimonadales bacterium]|jgi:predicted Zn-dependent peptidase|nr:pitrilysin family protein [Candidatus Saccharimonadales bacterium]